MHKVLEMAEGIDVGKMPSYELVPNVEAKKRLYSSDGSKSINALSQSYLSVDRSIGQSSYPSAYAYITALKS